MKKIVYICFLSFAISGFFLLSGKTPDKDCLKDISDKRGIMKPWEKGALETGKYRIITPGMK